MGSLVRTSPSRAWGPAALISAATAFCGADTLWQNGPYITGENSDGSYLMSKVPPESESVGWLIEAPARAADDFIIPEGETWHIDTATVYMYEWKVPGAEPVSTSDAFTARIWAQNPQFKGSEIIFGDDQTNRLLGTEFTGVYRVQKSQFEIDDKPIFAYTLDLNITLGPGTYWLDWSSETSSAEHASWIFPVTIPDEPFLPFANSIFTANPIMGYVNSFDTQTGALLEWVFALEGEVVPPGSCSSDFDGSGAVDAADLNAVLGEFGCESGCGVDTNGDGATDAADLNAVLAEFGSDCNG